MKCLKRQLTHSIRLCSRHTSDVSASKLLEVHIHNDRYILLLNTFASIRFIPSPVAHQEPMNTVVSLL
jgi:hypothetical protein